MTYITNNTIYLRRRKKLVLPVAQPGAKPLPLNAVTTMAKNIESLGFAMSPELIEGCRALSMDQLVQFYSNLVIVLKKATGSHKAFRPMYPNFPTQVMEMSDCELYINAIVHYLSLGRLLPKSELKARFPLIDTPDLAPVGLGTNEDFRELFGQIAGANASLSLQDKEDLVWFVDAYESGIDALIPESVPQKENAAYLASLLIEKTGDEAVGFVSKFVKTATDVLRLAVALSGGDVSLAKSSKFRTFKRPERALFLALLERKGNIKEDMLRWKGRWIRLGEKLHPGEYVARYPQAAAAFSALQNKEPIVTFNGSVERALTEKRVGSVLSMLEERPGDFARRLDHVLRLDPKFQADTITVFNEVAHRVSTPVLLQVMHHFKVRNEHRDLRTFFPKGQLAKMQAIPDELPAIPAHVCGGISAVCEAALYERFKELPELGKVYIGPELSGFLVPSGMRSASKSFRTVVRGSKLPLPKDCKTLRFFLWWKDGAGTTDIDLSAVTFGEQFVYQNTIAYYNLKTFGGHHSGDITSAPNGAAEFIDIDVDLTLAQGVRYVGMILNSYSGQHFSDLPECFAGWMSRTYANSGEIFEPKTVVDRLDLTAETKISIPLVIDLKDKQVIWCDLGLKHNPQWSNNVAANRKGIDATIQAMSTLNKPTLHDLFAIHARARGVLVDSPAEVDTVFSLESGTPFRLEEIASQYML